jgi:hypothetical protein
MNTCEAPWAINTCNAPATQVRVHDGKPIAVCWECDIDLDAFEQYWAEQGLAQELAALKTWTGRPG